MSALAGAVDEALLERGDATAGEIRCHLVRLARRAGTRAGLIVVHEAMGLNDHIRDVAGRFAALGYDVAAPDLYTRSGPPDAADVASIMHAMLGLPDAQIVADLEATAGLLRRLDGASGRVGCVGFCSGGRQALLLASSSSRVDATIDCWGSFLDRASPDAEVTDERPVKIIDLVENVHGPLLLVGGAEDQNPSPRVLALASERARASGADIELTIYEGAGHAFFADYRPSYREGPAFLLWDAMKEFLARSLA